MKMRKLGKKGDAISPIVAIVLVALVVVLIVILFGPRIWEAIRSFFLMIAGFLKLAGIATEGDSFIRSFQVENGLGGTLMLRYRFINDQSIASYQINASWATGNAVTDVVKGLKTTMITEEIIDEPKRQEYLAKGKELTYEVASPAGLDPKRYTIFAFDSTGKLLEKKDVDYQGAFADNIDKYLPAIKSFMEFGDSLNGFAGTGQGSVLLNNELVIVGFSRDFNDGKARMKKFNWASTVFGCSEKDIAAPGECKDQAICLCLCKNLGNAEKICADTNRICYGYEGYDFIGGARRTCGPEGWFGNTQGKDGEASSQITKWKDSKFEDSQEVFNSLAISGPDDNTKLVRLGVSVNKNEITVEGLKKEVSSLVIAMG
jgi:hypothetical protein